MQGVIPSRDILAATDSQKLSWQEEQQRHRFVVPLGGFGATGEKKSKLPELQHPAPAYSMV